MKVCKKTREIPIEFAANIPHDKFEESRKYSLEKTRFSVFKIITSDIVIVTLELYFGVLAALWKLAKDYTLRMKFNSKNELIVSCVFIVMLTVIGTVKEMPFTVYRNFVLEKRHGLHQKSVGQFMLEQIKLFIYCNVLYLLVASAHIYVAQLGIPYFYIGLWAVMALVSVVMQIFWPLVSFTLFDKHVILEEGPLRNEITSMMDNAKFPMDQVYVSESPMWSECNYVCVTEVRGEKRIVLFDPQMVQKASEMDSNDREFILAILAYELGHWKHRHNTIKIILMQVQKLLSFVAFGLTYKYDPLYRAVGFPVGEKPIVIGLLLIFGYAMAWCNAIITFAIARLSHKFVYEADLHAKWLGHEKSLVKALLKISTKNMVFPVNDWMYSMWNHSQPTILQRVNAMKEHKKTE